MKSIALAALWAALLLIPSPAGAEDEAWREFRGQVVVSDVLLAPKFGSDELMILNLHRLKRTVVKEANGFWRLHFVAFLDPAAEGDTMVLVARDLTVPSSLSASASPHPSPVPPRQVRLFEVPVEPAQRIVQVNDFVLSSAMGFVSGHDYELAVEQAGPDDDGTGARSGGKSYGKQDVCARGVVTLR
jgi:hypothetical protein